MCRQVSWGERERREAELMERPEVRSRFDLALSKSTRSGDLGIAALLNSVRIASVNRAMWGSSICGWAVMRPTLRIVHLPTSLQLYLVGILMTHSWIRKGVCKLEGLRTVDDSTWFGATITTAFGLGRYLESGKCFLINDRLRQSIAQTAGSWSSNKCQ